MLFFLDVENHDKFLVYIQKLSQSEKLKKTDFIFCFIFHKKN